MLKKLRFFEIILFLILAGFASWLIWGGTEVVALKTSRQNAIKGITVTGNVVSTETTDAKSKVFGIIEEIRVSKGDFVKKGQILLTLEKGVQEAKVTAALYRLKAAEAASERTIAQFKDAESDEKRYEELFEEGAVSKRSLEERTLRRKELKDSIDQRKAEIKEAKAQLASVKSDLEYYVIRSPHDGFITAGGIATGTLVSPNEIMFRLVDPKYIYLEADIEENELPAIYLDQTALIILDAYPEKVFEQKVYVIIPEVNPDKGTFKAKITKPEQQGLDIYIGMTFDATLIVEEYKDILIIPRDFVVTEKNKTYVFKANGPFTKRTEIKSEFFDNNSIKILDGIVKGDVLLKRVDKGMLTEFTKYKIMEIQEQ